MEQQLIPFPRRLGKLKPKQDKRLLRLSTYMGKDFVWPVPPSTSDWTKHITAPSGWGMMKNDQYSDCTCATAGHMIMSWTAAVGMLFVPSDGEIIQVYSDVTGFDPKTGANDNGAVETDILNYWRKTGVAGHKIGGYAAIDYAHNRLQTQLAVYLFGGAYIGVDLPLTAQAQQIWDVVPGQPQQQGGTTADPGTWGGHAVPILAYDDTYLTVVTWGAPLKMTWAFYQKYCEEAYAIFSQDFVTGAKPAPNGFDFEVLRNDIDHINQAA